VKEARIVIMTQEKFAIIHILLLAREE